MKIQTICIAFVIVVASSNAAPSPQGFPFSESSPSGSAFPSSFGSLWDQLQQFQNILRNTMRNLNTRRPSNESSSSSGPGIFSSIFTPLFNISRPRFPSFPLFNLTDSPSNSTYETKIINGHEVKINRTTGTKTFGNNGVINHSVYVYEVAPRNETDAEYPDDAVNDIYSNYEDFSTASPLVHNVHNRERRWSMNDFVETLLRMKYSLFLKPKNMTTNNTKVTVEDVEEITSNDLNMNMPSSSDLSMNYLPEKARDLSGDTRVNYAMGHHRNVIDDNSDAEVFDWRLLNADAHKNSGHPEMTSSLVLQPEAASLDDSRDGIEISSNGINDPRFTPRLTNRWIHSPRRTRYPIVENF